MQSFFFNHTFLFEYDKDNLFAHSYIVTNNPNANKLYAFIRYRVFLFNTDNLCTILWFKVTILI